MIKTIENLKSGNYEVVDNQGVSVTNHFIECLENEIKDLIEPKFKIGQRVWNVWSTIRIENHIIDTIHIYRDGKIGYELDNNFDVFWEHELFMTEEEALKRLEELRGE